MKSFKGPMNSKELKSRSMPYKFLNRKIKNAFDVGINRLCLGCGACFSVCPEEKIKLVDVIDDGIRPFVSQEGCKGCDICLQVCPGINTSIDKINDSKVVMDKRWGPILEMWEGYAADKEIRFKGSSGGLCTALSLFCLESDLASKVLHIDRNSETPWKNVTVKSETREELVARTGSRYAPAAPCDGLREIEENGTNSVFIGKPCDICGFRLVGKIKTQLAKQSALAIGFFCAGTPSTKGTLDLFKKYNTDPKDLADFRYRGMGWPGMATMTFKSKRAPVSATYNESWGFVQKYRPLRCYLCPDLTAEFADVSVGDPWYREIGEHEPGRSIILIRTEKGREIFHKAMEHKYIVATPANSEILYRSQVNLLSKRQAIWGRILAMKALGVPVPHLEGFHLFQNWMDLPFMEKTKSIMGTARRIVQRNYFKPQRYTKPVESNNTWIAAKDSKYSR